MSRYICHVHRYADDGWPCDLCESDRVEPLIPTPGSYRERSYLDAVIVEARAVLWRQGQGRE